MMTLNRRFHKAYQRTRDANFSLEGWWALISLVKLRAS
ncbi:D-lactate dehydrogenase [Vibrio ishigakensis]|uniref:D-lactate dehydrogenase n=1 Tax=Vibrio ishigakensis TaxID=1481914 RepID=A0A0B8Q8J2_9VIBR|nr:D-lactate dehydrogenase [Vibrio sp. JCM 19236]GAM73272.1 D-lactate dehydrogenase [Vibrio ishigakensis]